MTLMSDKQIRTMQEDHNIIINFDPRNVQPCSYDIRLSNQLISMKAISNDAHIDPMYRSAHNVVSDTFVMNGEYLLKPGEFVLGSTYERVQIPDNVAVRFEGKSSLGRMGLMTHVTAGFIDPGFQGNITVEIKNIGNVSVILRPYMRIGQLCFYTLPESVEQPYGHELNNNHYQFQSGPTLSF